MHAQQSRARPGELVLIPRGAIRFNRPNDFEPIEVYEPSERRRERQRTIASIFNEAASWRRTGNHP